IVYFDGMELQSTGTYTIVTQDHENNDTGDYGLSLSILNDPSTAENTIICTTDLMDSFEHQTHVNAYAYTGNAGDLMVIQMRALQGNIESQLRLYDPNGNLLAEAFPAAGISRIDAFTLPESGTYTVLCMDKNGNDLGDYGFSIQWINTDNCAEELICGEGQTATLDYIAQMHAYHIDVNSGDRIYIRMRGTAGIEAELQLYDSAGTLVASDAPSIGMATIENYLVADGGTYFVLARDAKGNDTGDYGIIYRNLTEGCSMPLDCDMDFTSSLDHLADMDLYRFEGQAGDKFWVQTRSSNSSLEEQLEWYDSEGNQLGIDIAGGMASLPEIVLPADGSYFIFLCDKSGNDIGEYGLAFQKTVNADCPPAFACEGGTITATFNHLAELQTFSLAGTAGQLIQISMIEESEDLEPLLCVCDPSGNIIIDTTASHDITIHDFVLPETGEYLLLAMDRNGNDFGSYILSVQTDCPEVLDTFPPDIYDCTDLYTSFEEIYPDGFTGEMPDLIAQWLTLVQAYDGEGDVSITHNFDLEGFSCNNNISGTQSVTFTATDESGNTATCVAMVSITGNEPPQPTVEELPTLQGDCEVELAFPTATDACSGELIYGTTTDPTYYDEQGEYFITWYYEDENGNISTQYQTVIVFDETPPLAACEDLTITLDEQGYAFIDQATIAGSSYDECGLYFFNTQPFEFTCEDVGAHELDFSIMDVNGNVTFCTVVITVEQSEACTDDFECGELPDDCWQVTIGQGQGDACYNYPNDIYEISAQGGDIYGTSDQCHYVYTQLNGSYYIKTKMLEMNATQDYALGGLMMRKQINNPKSRNISLLLSGEGHLLLQVREKNNKYTYVNDLGEVSLPIWLKLEYIKSERVALAYISEDGYTWDQVCGAEINLNGNFYAGMAVSSYIDTEENVAQFQYAQAGWIPSSFTAGSSIQPGTDMVPITCNDEVELREDAGNCNTVTLPKSKNKAKKISCYPNPALEHLSVDLTDFEKETVDVMLVDLSGKIVWQTQKEITKGEQLQINLLSLPLEQGYYRMMVRNGKKVTSKPVFIIRPED
ncbi:MAG TPA: T9SS type A sorting domain-containing protein, partial [Phaeodactylibacter sp.]|nr:T9SS type A sorting domain-containing protein [Phaeodactylibacter sp.]